MKLNHDCVRDVLLYLEDNLFLGKKIKFDFKTDIALNSKYSNDDLVYTSLKLLEADFINAKTYNSVQSYGPVVIEITSITYNGHLFLDNIRDNNVWNKAKNITKSLTSVSISLLSNIASTILTTIISKNL